MTFPKLPTLLHWIKERDSIRKKKVQGLPKPWTTDPILRNYRFCNVKRQDDKVTIWIANNWYQYHDSPHFVGAITLARLFNQPGTLKYMEFPQLWDLTSMKQRVDEYRRTGSLVFNAAYIVSTCGVAMDKVDYVLRVADDAKSIRPYKGDTLDSYAKRLMAVKGLGSGFLAAQVIADLKYTPLLSDALDWWTWCLPGPGSLRGMNRLCGQNLETRWAVSTFQSYVRKLKEAINTEIAFDLHAQDIQNCLCEFDKYVRAQEGGRPKQGYPG